MALQQQEQNVQPPPQYVAVNPEDGGGPPMLNAERTVGQLLRGSYIGEPNANDGVNDGGANVVAQGVGGGGGKYGTNN